MKHITLCRILEYLKRKDKPFRVIDTHAGAGLYDLSGDESARTGEWQSGIGRIDSASLDGPVAQLLSPYLEAVSAARELGENLYPGSPWITRHLLRRLDRLTAIELHPQDSQLLRELFAGDIQTRTIQLDGWLSLGAHVPPKEKRGLILVDPPFEQAGEFDRLLEGAVKAHRRWPGGLQALWYPIKDREAVAAFRQGLAASGIPKVLDLSVMIRAGREVPTLDGCGMVVVNPPFVLEEEMRVILPVLTRLLGKGRGASWDAVWLASSETSA